MTEGSNMEMPNPLRRQFDADQGPMFGVFTVLRDPAVVELIALAGFDWAGLEMEHGPYSLEALENHHRAALAAGIGTMVKLPAGDPNLLLRVLETGVDGVLLAAAPDLDAVRTAVASCRYPPDGTRGLSTIVRRAGYGSAGFSNEALDARNRDLLVGVLVETPGVLADIELVSEIPGIDYLFVGVADLATAIGDGEIASPDVVSRAVDRVVSVCVEKRLPLALPLGHPAYPRTASELAAIGTRIVTAASDVSALLNGLRTAFERTRN
jgi:2-keto-3-deoxy-L-rhamnonate aldolase RhmA